MEEVEGLPRARGRVIRARPRSSMSTTNNSASSRPSSSVSISRGGWDGMLDSAFPHEGRSSSMQAYTEQVLKAAAMRIWEHHDCIVASQRQDMRNFGFTGNPHDNLCLRPGEPKLRCTDGLRDTATAGGAMAEETQAGSCAPGALQPKFPDKPPSPMPPFGEVERLEPLLFEELSPNRLRGQTILQAEHESKSGLPGCVGSDEASKPSLPGCPDEDSPRVWKSAVRFEPGSDEHPSMLEDVTRDTSKKSNRSKSSMSSAATSKSSMSFFKDNTGRASRMWLLLEEPDSSRAAWWLAKIWNYFIGCAVVLSILESTNPPALSGFAIGVVQAVIEGIMLAEWVARLIVSHSARRFLTNWQNILDFLACCPFGLRLATGFILPRQEEDLWMHYALVCSAPLLRLLKLIRRFRKFHLFVHVLKQTNESLQVLLFLLTVLVMFFSCLIYIIEPQDNVDSLTTAMWMSIVTVTTVGYGDVTPKTLQGRFICGLLVLSSVLYMAMPISIVGDAFTKTWADRHRLLLMVRTRDRLTQFGYSAADMPKLFNRFDENGNGELCLEEFSDMIGKMGVGMKTREAEALFEVFDEDGSGAVDEKEFMKALFPNEYRIIYGRRGSVTFGSQSTREF